MILFCFSLTRKMKLSIESVNFEIIREITEIVSTTKTMWDISNDTAMDHGDRTMTFVEKTLNLDCNAFFGPCLNQYHLRVEYLTGMYVVLFGSLYIGAHDNRI